MKKTLSLLALLSLFAVAAYADIRLPDTPKPTPEKTPKKTEPIDATLQIRFSDSEKTARLIIPRSQLPALRAELDRLDAANAAASGGITRTQTVASGLLLSLALVAGGVWFARAGGKAASKKAKVIAAGALLFGSGAFASIAFANIAPPQRAPITSQIFNTKAFNSALGVQGAIKLEVSDTSSWVQLVVPRVREEKPE